MPRGHAIPELRYFQSGQGQNWSFCQSEKACRERIARIQKNLVAQIRGIFRGRRIEDQRMWTVERR